MNNNKLILNISNMILIHNDNREITKILRRLHFDVEMNNNPQ